MDWSLYPHGILIGFSVAVPVGPMALLCLRRTLSSGRGVGLSSGIGIATADAFYGAVAAFGITSISAFLVEIQDLVRFGGGLFLCYLGWRTFRSLAGGVDRGGEPVGVHHHLGAFGSTLGLTLTNPTTILSFAAIFAGFGVAGHSGNTLSALALVLGVFCGSTLWWLVLVFGIGRLREWLTSSRLTVINRACGLAIGLFGVLALLSVIR